MKPDQADIEKLLIKLDQLINLQLDTKLRPKVPLNQTLWNTSDIADYLGLSYKHTSEYIVTHHSFPAASRLPTKNKTKGHPRWYAGKVIEWVEQHMEK